MENPNLKWMITRGNLFFWVIKMMIHGNTMKLGISRQYHGNIYWEKQREYHDHENGEYHERTYTVMEINHGIFYENTTGIFIALFSTHMFYGIYPLVFGD